VLCALALLALACRGERPRHVISLSPSTTQVAAAMGLGDRLESLDPHAPDAIERAFRSGANLALAGPDAADATAAFASRSIPVRVFSPLTTEQALSAYTEIASALGSPRAARGFIQRVGDALESRKQSGGPQVALVVSRSPLRVVGGDAYLSHLLELAGVTNVFADQKGAIVSMAASALDARKARVVDVPQSVVAGAWVDPLGTVQALEGVLTASD
jgi:hypothetical protein